MSTYSDRICGFLMSLLLMGSFSLSVPTSAAPPDQSSPNDRRGPSGGEPWCAIHLINVRNDEDVQTLIGQLPELKEMGVNVIILEVNYRFQYKSHPELRQGNEGITYDGANKLTEACKKRDIRLIPQFQCLGHQSWDDQTFPLLQEYPSLDMTPDAFENNEGTVNGHDFYCREWDPENPKVTEIVTDLMDELIDAFDADAFHVGMDEVFLIGHEASPSTRNKDPANVFAREVKEFHDYLVGEKNVEMLMWGDRLINADKYNHSRWEASKNGTWEAIDKIPKDIIICDWHYGKRSTYPTVDLFIQKGFRVLPAGYNDVSATKAYLEYSQSKESENVLGFLFTTWSSVDIKDLPEYPPLVQGRDLLFDTKK